jgi:hypothetical protein
LVAWLLGGEDGIVDLLGRRKVAHLTLSDPSNVELLRELVVMGDDPSRVIVLDQPSIPTG